MGEDRSGAMIFSFTASRYVGTARFRFIFINRIKRNAQRIAACTRAWTYIASSHSIRCFPMCLPNRAIYLMFLEQRKRAASSFSAHADSLRDCKATTDCCVPCRLHTLYCSAWKRGRYVVLLYCLYAETAASKSKAIKPSCGQDVLIAVY